MRKSLTLDPLPPFDTRNFLERRYNLNSFHRPFSGYLGGRHTGGYWIERLSEDWANTFNCKHAIPCNSATSGLLAACMAAGVGPTDEVWTTVYSMSATAACARVLGASVKFVDIEPDYFSFDLEKIDVMAMERTPKAIIVTNLFGHPAVYLHELRRWCDGSGITLIEDNAQASFSRVHDDYTGTIGHIGIFSLNVHKHLQTGEGGVVVTNSDNLALSIKDAINHGELRGGIIGLNLRMTEPIAAMASAQLSKAKWIIESRIALGQLLTGMCRDIPEITPPVVKPDHTHVYYIWAAKVGFERGEFIKRLNACGFPMNAGYSPPLNRVFNSNGGFPVAESMEDKHLITFDICSYSPKRRHIRKMRDILHAVSDSFKGE